MRFGWRVILFLLPVLIPIGLLEMAFDVTGESWPMSRVLDVQRAEKAEVPFSRYYFSQSFNTYKREGAKQANARILVAGSSRVMRIRSKIFEPMGHAVYNAGGLLQRPSDIAALVDLIERGDIQRPDVLIIGIDPWWIRVDRERASWVYDEDETETAGAHLEAIRRFSVLSWQRGWQNPFGEGQKGQTKTIGLAARLSGSGFVLDGSRVVGSRFIEEFDDSRKYVDAEVPPVITRVRSKLIQFRLPVAVSQKSVESILTSLETLQIMGTEVVVLFQPFSTEVVEALTESPELAGWFEYYYGGLRDSLQEKGILVSAVKDPSYFGLDDTFMLDGFHPSEVLAAHIVQDVIRRAPPSSTLQEVDQTRLTSLIEGAYSPVVLEKP